MKKQQSTTNQESISSSSKLVYSKSFRVNRTDIFKETAPVQKVDSLRKLNARVKKKKAKELNNNNLRRTMLVLRAVNHVLRQKIIQLLTKKKELTVSEIYVKLKLEQCVASQHLAILRKAEIVITKKTGKYVYYSLNKDRISHLSELTLNLAN